jgi:hypothetical protein
MGQEIQLPDWAKKGQAQAFAGLNPHDDSLAAGIGQSYGIIGYKGKQWTLRIRGERHAILRPDDGTPSAFLDVIILGQAKTKSKSYYPKGFTEGSSERPLCASIDSVVPDSDVTQKQNDNCATCPRNEWKVDATTGRKGRECTDYKRLAVLILPTQTKAILGETFREPVFLRVPPDSLNSLAIMGDGMSGQGHHYSSYITRITFDPDKAHPSMVFRPLQPLSEKEAPVILDLRQDAQVGRITGDKASAIGLKAVEQALTPATGLTVSTGVTGQASPGVAGNQPLPQKDQTGTTLVDTGFGGATPATPQGDAPAGTSGATTIADAGEPEESDAALDARIASMVRR